MNVNIIYATFTKDVNALTRVNTDGTPTIFINKNKCPAIQKRALMHELEHINNNDFDLQLQADLIEKMIHRELKEKEYNDFDFFVTDKI